MGREVASDRFSEPVRRGGFPRLPSRRADSLPTATANFRGCVAIVTGELATDADVAYVCLANADGTFSWIEFAAGAP